MIEKIVVATDGSEHSRKAVALACDIAKLYKAELILCHVHRPGPVPDALRHMAEVEHLSSDGSETRPSVTNVPANVASFLREEARSREAGRAASEWMAKRVVQDAEAAARETGVKSVRSVLEEGEPAEQILGCAARESADMIIVGSRGLGNLKGMMLGSTSRKVSQLADRTTISVR